MFKYPKGLIISVKVDTQVFTQVYYRPVTATNNGIVFFLSEHLIDCCQDVMRFFLHKCKKKPFQLTMAKANGYDFYGKQQHLICLIEQTVVFLLTVKCY